MKILSVVGARPQFVKAASVSKELRKLHTEILVHTGQHYDDNMSQVFFDELDIPTPNYNLNVGSKSHAKQTADIMCKLEDILFDEKPDIVLVYGDTNSTAAAAITSAKLNIPIAHVEAGARTLVRDMPEEQNRIITDHLSHWNFAASKDHLDSLHKENITQNAYYVGDVMYDGIIHFSKKLANFEDKYFFNNLEYYIPNETKINKWYFATLHRPENVDNIDKIKSILDGLEKLNYPVIFSVHPRTYLNVSKILSTNIYKNIHFVKPLSYLKTIFLRRMRRK